MLLFVIIDLFVHKVATFVLLIYIFYMEQWLWLIGPSGVRVLPLTAGMNVGGHYKWHFFSFFLLSSGSLLILPEGVVIGIQIFAWAPN